MTELLNVTGLDATGYGGVDPVVQVLILALPALVLLTLIAIVLSVRKSRKRSAAPIPQPEHKPLAALSLPQDDATMSLENQPRTVVSAPQAPAARPPPDDAGSREDPDMAEICAVDVAQSTANVPRAAPPTVALSFVSSPSQLIADLQTQIEEAMKVQPNVTLAPLFLEMARHHKTAGDEKAYLAALRSAAGLAAQHGPRSAHADARLQLAEAAFLAGDLTGACEQWQIARDALLHDGQKEAYNRVDQRMRDNGCPTDWVLTDF